MMKKIQKVKTRTFRPIKPFQSIDEEANFWDSHSAIGEIDDGTLVGFHQANKTHTITIRFEPKHLQVLREEAFQRGIGPTTLARMWILAQLKQQA